MRRLRRCFACVFLLLLVGLAGFIFRAPLLRNVAAMWIVTSPPVKADAVVVLGGGIDSRPFAAARYYREGWASNVIIMNVQLGPADELGLRVPESQMIRRVLTNQGVPESALIEVGQGVASSRDEAEALREWALKSKPKTILIPTDSFHTRRVNWFFNRRLKDTGAHVQTIAADPPRFDATNWWRHENTLISFQNEVVKTLLYRWKY